MATKKTTKTVSDETLERMRNRVQNKLLTKALEVECARAVDEEVGRIVRSKAFREALNAEVKPLVFNSLKKNRAQIIAEVDKCILDLVKNINFY